MDNCTSVWDIRAFQIAGNPSSSSMIYPKPPSPFLQVVLHDLGITPTIAALCAGYEMGQWRATALSEHLMEWLPEFALSAEELRGLEPGSALRLFRKAAQLVYQTDKYRLRGEFGEMFLHLALRQIHGSIPAISKIYWKDSIDTTVKGFDAVHVVAQGKGLELWLGEVKFYDKISSAIREVISELDVHTKADYLKREFAVLTNKLDAKSPHFEKLSRLLNPNTSLDEVFDAACIPVLLTYDSPAVKSHSRSDPAYRAAIKAECMKILTDFKAKLLPLNLPLKVHLFLLPLHAKKDLVQLLDARLKALQ